MYQRGAGNGFIISLVPRTFLHAAVAQSKREMDSLRATKSSGIMFASAFLQVNFKSAQVSFE